MFSAVSERFQKTKKKGARFSVMALECSSRTRKRKNIDQVQIQIQTQQQEEASVSAELVQSQSLAQAEAEDLEDLTSIASEATVIEFDSRTGRPLRCPRPLSLSPRLSSDKHHDDDDDDENSPINGLVKISNELLLENDPNLFRDLALIHSIVKQKVHIRDMVPWAGIDGDSTRLRAFGFLGKSAMTRLDGNDNGNGSSTATVRLHAPEKQGQDALRDERANLRAICILNKTRERVVRVVDNVGGDAKGNSNNNKKNGRIPTAPKTVNPTLVADNLCAAILANDRTTRDSNNNCYLNSNVLCSNELIAYQTNLHNGAKHLAAHLDAPLHEGFGKVIVTVAIRGSATILLIGKGADDDDDDDDDCAEDEDEKSNEQLQPAWKFQLNEGEAYVLSGNARNICLHAVLANDGGSGSGSGGDRESLNLRFGIHSTEEAEKDIKRHWPDLW